MHVPTIHKAVIITQSLNAELIVMVPLHPVYNTVLALCCHKGTSVHMVTTDK
jgi:hypothetical protein